MKKFIALIGILTVGILTFTGCAKPPCYNCGFGKKGSWNSTCSSDKSCLVEECLLKAPCLAIHKKDELELSDEQVTKIKDLCVTTKKEYIQLDADIEKLCVDVKAKMFDDTFDEIGINSLIDNKYELQKKQIKLLISSYGKLNGILTEEQKEKFKAFKKDCDGCKGCPCAKSKNS